MDYEGMKNPTVVIFCHSRAELLETAIQSFMAAEESENWTLVVVQQVGFTKVSSVLENYRERVDSLYTFLPVSDHYLANINHSRIVGWEIAFHDYDSSFVLGIEEDTSIARDTLVFSRMIFSKYVSHPRFRGINYTSFLEKDPGLLHTYTLRRFGLSGQCGGLPRSTWEKFDLECLRGLGSNEEWASHIEPIMKTGFTIFPNQSRALDQGWGGTSDSNSKSTDEYFTRHRQSWVEKHTCEDDFSRFDGRAEIWRDDAILYQSNHNIYFSLREKIFLQKVYRVFRKLGFPKLKTMVFGKD